VWNVQEVCAVGIDSGQRRHALLLSRTTDGYGRISW
jgi:hypothetical protein